MGHSRQQRRTNGSRVGTLASPMGSDLPPTGGAPFKQRAPSLTARQTGNDGYRTASQGELFGRGHGGKQRAAPLDGHGACQIPQVAGAESDCDRDSTLESRPSS